MNDDLFDLENLDDLPSDVKAHLAIGIQSTNGNLILDLFKLKNPLTIDETIVGLFRKYQVKVNRRYVINFFSRFTRKGIFNKINGKKCTYELPSIPR